MIIETERLYLRKLMQNDFEALCGILQDDETMYAYEGAFSDEEVQEWLDRQLARYEKYGFGLWAVILKENGELIGQCGLTMQPWKAWKSLKQAIFSTVLTGTGDMQLKRLLPAKNTLLRCLGLRRFAQLSGTPTLLLRMWL